MKNPYRCITLGMSLLSTLSTSLKRKNTMHISNLCCNMRTAVNAVTPMTVCKRTNRVRLILWQDWSKSLTQCPVPNCSTQTEVPSSKMPIEWSALTFRVPSDVYIHWKKQLPVFEPTYIYIRVIHRIFLLLLLAGGIPLCTNQKVRHLLC